MGGVGVGGSVAGGAVGDADGDGEGVAAGGSEGASALGWPDGTSLARTAALVDGNGVGVA